MSTTCRETWAGRWPRKVGEVVRLAVDYALDEALAGDSLTGTPTFTLVTVGSGVILSGQAVSGTTASALFNAAAGLAGDWEVKVSVGTTGGQTLVKSATLGLDA
jgi:hypothetical protein